MVINNIEDYKSTRSKLADLERKQKFHTAHRNDKRLLRQIALFRQLMDDYLAKYETIRTNLKQLNADNPTPFSEDIIHNYYTYLRDNSIYLKAEHKSYMGVIPVDQVVGIDQMYGDDATWSDCLNGAWLKRIERNLEALTSNPLYYLDTQEKSGLSFIKIGDHYFISQGKHRTVIARFFKHFNPQMFSDSEPSLHAYITEYFIDREFMIMKHRLEQLNQDWSSLQMEINHVTSMNDPQFLIIRKRGDLYEDARFTRAQYETVVDALTNCCIGDKWRSHRKMHDPNIYDFISYAQCLSNYFKS
ncbi:hypothetical protein VIBNISOn1_1050010 [Vibrio nigripulchritudo SOn1]|uniref:Uncharacterized protein n=1 Tax=Vibrio nigripulchritudo SOn1 TaxID=1238450 RepID=A0AAV2VI66_9VIBR|nr:hypothetical protein [Vibrio nigripulchritudo]CCO44184.1 hypothetical protein VIBNISOn1_1050010 [Vibrio nigripulchritudo SOn1]